MEVLQMKYPTRIYYTEADKSLMWDRWQKGESLNAIGRSDPRPVNWLRTRHWRELWSRN